jgi:hypothetical protein
MRDLWEYRELLYFLVWREVKGRYRQTLLGPIWFVLSPLVRMAVFSFVFGQIAELPSDGIPYPLFTYTALLPWELFAGVVHRSTGSLVAYMNIISKVYFPRLVVPLSAALSGLVDFGVSFIILLGMVLFFGYPLAPRLLTWLNWSPPSTTPGAARSSSAWRMERDNWSAWLTRKESRKGSSTFCGLAVPWTCYRPSSCLHTRGRSSWW